MTRLRVGIVGAGIGASHIEAYKALEDMYEVVSLCDINRERGIEVAGKFQISTVDTNIEDLFGRDLDIVDVCTPAGLHFEHADAALKAGCDVVLEKPAARSLAEIDALAETAAATGKTICPVFQYRFGHGVQKLHHLIEKGIAGVPSIATAETHWFRSDDYYAAARWRGTWDGEIGGCLASHAIHIHDILCEVLGPVSSVHARTSRRLNGNETEDMGILSLEFESGAMASSSVTLGSRQEMSRLRFCFDGLVAESGRSPYNPGHEPWTFAHDDPEAAKQIAAALEDFNPLPERFVGQLFRTHKALTEGAALPVTLDNARRSIESLTAAYWSAHSGEAVSLPLPKTHPFYNGWLETMKSGARHG